MVVLGEWLPNSKFAEVSVTQAAKARSPVLYARQHRLSPSSRFTNLTLNGVVNFTVDPVPDLGGPGAFLPGQ